MKIEKRSRLICLHLILNWSSHDPPESIAHIRLQLPAVLSSGGAGPPTPDSPHQLHIRLQTRPDRSTSGGHLCSLIATNTLEGAASRRLAAAVPRPGRRAGTAPAASHAAAAVTRPAAGVLSGTADPPLPSQNTADGSGQPARQRHSR